MRPLLRRFALALLTLLGCAAPEAAHEPQGHALAATTSGAAAALEPAPTDLEVHFIDVGTGDCIWIRTGDDGIPGNGRLEGMNIVIDGGVYDAVLELANTPTRLKQLSDRRQARLINWGYAVCDAAFRQHAGPLDPPGSLPYPEASI